MIYLVTNQSVEPYSDDIATANVEDVLNYFKDKPEIGVDTETTGFDPFTKKILLLQLGDEYIQFVIDVSTVDILQFKVLLETKKIILHNAKFDLRFLYYHGIKPYKNIFDTYLAERTLSLGIDSHRKALDACVYRYLKKTLNKDTRGLIHRLGIFNERIIRYSADDVKWLVPLKRAQENRLRELDLEISISLDNQFVSVLAYIEFCGVYIDKKGWINKSEEDKRILESKLEKLNEFVIENFKVTKYVEEPNLFNNKFTCKINWNSPQQVIPLFEELGIDCDVYDKGQIKKSIESTVLERQVDVHPIVPIFLEFQKAKKLVSTYGIDFLKHINPKTGRIHTNFTQIMNTGRLSSGKDKENENAKVGNVNMQNIPAGKERKYFGAEPGNVCVIADYSGQENHVLAEFANDPDFTSNIKDLHSVMASIIFPELKDLSIEEIKKNYPDKRQFSKAATFAIPYGGDGTTIADNLSLSREEGDRIYNEYVKRFPGLNKYFEEAKSQVLRDGYVLINNISKRKSFVPYFEQFKAQKKKMNNLFWEGYRTEKEKDSELFHKELKPFVSKYFGKKGSIERTGLNYRIQGTSSDMSKIAGIYMYDWILENDLWNVVKICVPLHDEYFLECPADLAEDTKDMLERSMVDAAKVFCKKIPLRVEGGISTYWKH